MIHKYLLIAFGALLLWSDVGDVQAQDDNWCENNRATYDHLSRLQRSGRELTDEQSTFINTYTQRCIQ